jgi:hypothetical protein
MERNIIFELMPITQGERKPMSEIWEEFNRDKPYILGAIFRILSKAIMTHKTGTKPRELPRLADFGVWGYCIGEALGRKGKEFLRQYEENRKFLNIYVLNSSEIAEIVMKYVDKHIEQTGETEFEIKSTDLYVKLKKLMEGLEISKYSRSFPQCPASLTKNLARFIPILEENGIQITTHRKNTGSYMRFKIFETATSARTKVNVSEDFNYREGVI